MTQPTPMMAAATPAASAYPYQPQQTQPQTQPQPTPAFPASASSGQHGQPPLAPAAPNNNGSSSNRAPSPFLERTGSAAELFASGPTTTPATNTSAATAAAAGPSFDSHDTHDDEEDDNIAGPSLTAAATLFTHGLSTAKSGAATLLGSAHKAATTAAASVGEVSASVGERGVSGSILGMVERAGMAPEVSTAANEQTQQQTQGGGELLVEDLDDDEDDESNLEEAGDNAGDANAAGPMLKEGWEEVVDDTTGQPYYYRAATGETTWDRPSVAAVADVGAVDAAAAPAVTQPEPQPQPEPTAEAEAVAAPPSTAPTELEFPPPPHQQEEAAEAEAALTPTPATDTDTDLPAAGWEEVVDEATGKPHYFHAATGETSWEKPAPVTASEIPAVEAPEALPVEPEPEPEPEPTMVPATPAVARQPSLSDACAAVVTAAFSAPPKQHSAVASSTPSQQQDQSFSSNQPRQVQSAVRPPASSSSTARARLNLPLPKRTFNVPSRTPRQQPGHDPASATGGASSVKRRHFKLPPPIKSSAPTPSQEDDGSAVPTPKHAIESSLPAKTPHNTPAFDVDYIEDTGQGPALPLPGSAAPGATGAGAGVGGAPAVVSAPAAPTAPIPTPALPPRGPTLPSMTPGPPAQPGSTVEAAAAALSHPFKIEKKLSFSSATAQEEHAQGRGDIDDDAEEEEEEEDDIGGASQEPLQPPQEGTVALTAGLIANVIVDEAIDRVVDTAVSGTADAEDVNNVAGAVVGDEDEDVPALPAGWQELTDPNSGQIYFYNSEIGETSWNRPTLADSSEDDVAGPSAENEEDAAHQPPETETSEETVKTRSSWEIVDNGAEPEPEPAEALSSAEGGNDGDSVDKWEAASPEAEDAGLPNGWVQVIDETSGEPYVSSLLFPVYLDHFSTHPITIIIH